MMKRKTSGEDSLHQCSIRDDNSYNSLCQRARERCEFCEKVFNSRLANIKHNATHIIIPLLKLSLHQCEECLFHFTSLNDLRTHATTKNHYTSQFNASHKAGYKDILKSIVKQQVVVKCYDTLKSSSPKLIISNADKPTQAICPKIEVKLEAPIEASSNSDRTSPHLDIKNDCINRIPEIYSQCEPIESIKSKIIYEEDFDDDLFEPEEILPDKCYPLKNSYIIGNINKSTPLNGTNKLNGDINNSTPLNGTNGVMLGKSVHYDELVAAEICDCRYCGRCFANRLELIKHETIHMQVTRTLPILCYVCEKYLSGNHWTLRRHLQNYHPTQERKLSIHKCTTCNLNYHNYQKHVNLYHVVTCKICNQKVDRKKLKYHDCFHLEPEINETVIKMCEMCLTFTKNKQNVHYVVLGEYSEVGTRQQCEKCLAKYFEVKLVKRMVRARIEDGEWKRKKPLSNKERLKKIQNRLKMVNKMNKC